MKLILKKRHWPASVKCILNIVSHSAQVPLGRPERFCFECTQTAFAGTEHHKKISCHSENNNTTPIFEIECVL